MKGRIVRGLLVAVLFMTSVRACSDQGMPQQDTPETDQPGWFRDQIHCKSIVPETEESFVHIGGGFFAYFNRRNGIAKKNSTLSSPCLNRLPVETNNGEIRFSLRELGYASRLVYLPKGSLELGTAEGRTMNFRMEVLDYVQLPGRELPCYRLIASGNQEHYSKAILICCALGTDSPALVGTLYLVSESGTSICSYEIEITGRNNVEAENHLWKVVEVASRF